MKMVMGGETEYAVSARDASGAVVPQPALLSGLFRHMVQTYPYTSTSTRGRFLFNGGLLYVDAGLHLEWSTPETTSPSDVVRYLKAGDRIVESLATSYGEKELGGQPVFGSRACVDYVSGTLWAAHESYMHGVDPDILPRELMPFLASRVIFGAGGWDRRAPALRFTMSPRASFISTPTDRDSQHVRPLFHTKDEPLSGAGHRLHVACSESLCSDVSNVLRFGTTALVLLLIERGERPGSHVPLVSSVRALKRFALDVELRDAVPLSAQAQVEFATTRRVSALEMQRYYLGCVERLLGQADLPTWAESVWLLWRDTLDALEARDPRVATTLDWAIKRRLFEHRLALKGISWASLEVWNGVLAELEPVCDEPDLSLLEIEELLEPDEDTRAQMDALSPRLAEHGLSWDALPELVAARREMFELDAKFAGLGPQGIFNVLDATGVLTHRLKAADMGDAVSAPPSDTRARVRGAVVRRLSGEGISYGAEWTAVYDRDRQLELDLMDPFETQERWRKGTVVGGLSARYA